MFSSLAFACMTYACGLLVMICHWHEGLPGLIVDLASLAISWITMVFWVHLFVKIMESRRKGGERSHVASEEKNE